MGWGWGLRGGDIARVSNSGLQECYDLYVTVHNFFLHFFFFSLFSSFFLFFFSFFFFLFLFV